MRSLAVLIAFSVITVAVCRPTLEEELMSAENLFEDDFCGERKDGNYPNPDHRHTFFTCSGGVKYTMKCPASLCYKHSINRCEHCSPTVIKGFCNGKANGNYANPDGKHSYIACNGNTGYIMPCPSKLCYEPSKDQCDWCQPGSSSPTTASPHSPRPTPPDGFCNGKKHGNYINPNDKHSFIACDGSQGYVMDCPNKLCYDQGKDQCDYCSSKREVVAVNPRPTPPNGFCNGKNHGNYENPNDKHSYIACDGSAGYVMPCPSKLCYVQSKDQCDWCSPSSTAAPRTRSPTTHRPTPPNGFCNGKEHGNYVNPNDKHSYIACDGSAGYVMPCPSKLCYVQSTDRCDWCQPSSSPSSSAPRTTASPRSPRPTPPNGFCNGKEHGNYVNPNDKHSYIACDGSAGYVMPCPSKLCYVQSTDRCDWCQPSSSPSSSAPRTTASPHSPRPTPPDGFCNGKKHGNYINPSDKHSFIACDGGRGHVMDCPNKLCYDQSKDQCDYCSSKREVVAVNPRPTPPNGFCNGKNHGNYENPNDKHSYIACDGGQGYVMPCPSQLCYVQSKDQCDWCSPSSTAAPRTQSPTTHRPTPPNGFCNGKEHGNYVNPSDKHSYIACDGSAGYVMPCPSKLCYVQSTDRCDWCQPSSSPSSSAPRTTASPHSPRPTPPDGFCNGKKHGNYINPNDKHSFIACDGGRGYVMDCPNKLCYDQGKDQCDYCSSKREVVAVNPRPTPPNGFCNDKNHGNYENPNDKHSYIACDGSAGYVMPCPSKLCYVQSKDQCDWCSPSSSAAPRTQSPITHRPTPPNGFCNGKKHGNYVNPNDKHSYIACDGSQGHVMPCPSKLCYDQSVDRCEWCQPHSSPPSSAPGTTASPHSARPTPPNGFCNGKKHGNYVNPNDKHSYVACDGSQGHVMPCPSKLCYDQSVDRCEWCQPHSSPSSSAPGTTASPHSARPTPPNGFCNGKKHGNYVNPNDKHSYIACDGSQGHVMPCPSKLCYDQSVDRCDWCQPHSLPSSSAPGTTASPHSARPTPPNGFCNGKKHGNYVNPNDKHSYIACDGSQGHVMPCPSKLCYDQSVDRCEWCQPHSSPSSSAPGTTASPHSARPTPPNGFCNGKKHGNYVNPNDKHSYIACDGSQGHVMPCPSKLCYDQSVDRCEWCRPHSSPSSSAPGTTASPHSARPTPPNGFCNGKKHGNYVNPNDKHSYIACDGSQGHVMPCPSKLCYDQSVDRCEWCNPSSRAATTTQSPTTHRPTPSDGFCYGKVNGNYENPKDKHTFISCSNGLIYVMKCPHKLCYESKTDRCENCADVISKREAFCANRANGNYPHGTDKHSFIICSNGIDYVMSCPVGLCYNGASDKCDYCKVSPTTTTVAKTVKPTPPKGFCLKKKDGNYPNPDDKHSFIICSNHVGHVFACPHKLCFNQKENQCDYCPKDSKRETFCANRANGNYPHGTDKHSFIICSNGIDYVMSCPVGLCYNGASDKCDYCKVSPTTTTVAKTVKPTPPKGFCLKKKDGNYPNPDDKHSFIICSNHVGHVFACPHKLCFNQKENQCDYCPKVAKREDFCAGKKNGNYAHPTHRSKYISCSNGHRYTMNCPSTLCFDQAKDMCDYCTSSTAKPPTTKATTVAPTPAKKFCEGKLNGNYENPHSKKSFISCSNGHTYVINCPSSLCYVKGEDKCLQCKSLEPREALDDVTRTHVSCVGRNIGFYPDLSCAKFIICDGHGNGKGKTCPVGLNFHPLYKMCVSERLYSCAYLGFCRGKSNGKYVNRNNCYGYYECRNGKTVIRNCPKKLKFNGDRCVPSSEYICNLV